MKKKNENVKFTKEQILKSKRYLRFRDLLNGVLKDNVEYTCIDIDGIIEGFLKGSVR